METGGVVIAASCYGIKIKKEIKIKKDWPPNRFGYRVILGFFTWGNLLFEPRNIYISCLKFTIVTKFYSALKHICCRGIKK